MKPSTAASAAAAASFGAFFWSGRRRASAPSVVAVPHLSMKETDALFEAIEMRSRHEVLGKHTQLGFRTRFRRILLQNKEKATARDAKLHNATLAFLAQFARLCDEAYLERDLAALVELVRQFARSLGVQDKDSLKQQNKRRPHRVSLLPRSEPFDNMAQILELLPLRTKAQVARLALMKHNLALATAMILADMRDLGPERGLSDSRIYDSLSEAKRLRLVEYMLEKGHARAAWHLLLAQELDIRKIDNLRNRTLQLVGDEREGEARVEALMATLKSSSSKEPSVDVARVLVSVITKHAHTIKHANNDSSSSVLSLFTALKAVELHVNDIGREHFRDAIDSCSSFFLTFYATQLSMNASHAKGKAGFFRTEFDDLRRMFALFLWQYEVPQQHIKQRMIAWEDIKALNVTADTVQTCMDLAKGDTELQKRVFADLMAGVMVPRQDLRVERLMRKLPELPDGAAETFADTLVRVLCTHGYVPFFFKSAADLFQALLSRVESNDERQRIVDNFSKKLRVFLATGTEFFKNSRDGKSQAAPLDRRAVALALQRRVDGLDVRQLLSPLPLDCASDESSGSDFVLDATAQIVWLLTGEEFVKDNVHSQFSISPRQHVHQLIPTSQVFEAELADLALHSAMAMRYSASKAEHTIFRQGLLTQLTRLLRLSATSKNVNIQENCVAEIAQVLQTSLSLSKTAVRKLCVELLYFGAPKARVSRLRDELLRHSPESDVSEQLAQLHESVISGTLDKSAAWRLARLSQRQFLQFHASFSDENQVQAYSHPQNASALIRLAARTQSMDVCSLLKTIWEAPIEDPHEQVSLLNALISIVAVTDGDDETDGENDDENDSENDGGDGINDGINGSLTLLPLTRVYSLAVLSGHLARHWQLPLRERERLAKHLLKFLPRSGRQDELVVLARYILQQCGVSVLEESHDLFLAAALNRVTISLPPSLAAARRRIKIDSATAAATKLAVLASREEGADEWLRVALRCLDQPLNALWDHSDDSSNDGTDPDCRLSIENANDAAIAHAELE
ncbi:MAG: hypothetical protein MHM6MM_002425 [Cercozoa sp. M6MM]